MVQQLPYELWLKIFALRRELSPWKLFLGKIRLPEAEIKHGRVWDALFDNYDFLNTLYDDGESCKLVGSRLDELYNFSPEETLQQQPDIIDLLLVFGEFWSPSEEMVSLFWSSLKKTLSGSKDQHPHEVTIALNTRQIIRLNITQLWSLNSNTVVDAPETLFSLKEDGLYSAYLYWKNDRKKLRTIKPKDIVGLGRYASRCDNTYYVSRICGITIPQPEERPTEIPYKVWYTSNPFAGKGFPAQIILEKPGGTLNLRAKYEEEGETSEPRRCLGWEIAEGFEELNEKLWKYRYTYSSRRKFYKA